jgi:hypothetical protein
MGKYTIFDNELVDKEIEEKLKLVVKLLKEELGNDLVSVILTGGYGRGEGSVIINESNIQLLKDFDIAVITYNKQSKMKINQITDKIYKALNLQDPHISIFKYSSFALDLRFLTIKDVNFPDIWFYDLKNSTVLYGSNVNQYITYSNNDIPFSSGLRLLFEKITGLLGHFKYSMLYNDISDDSRMRLIYECMKTYVEIATSLCILHRVYVSSYRERNNIIKVLNSKGLLQELLINIPDLIDKIDIATKFKLNPNYEIVKDYLDLFFTTKKDLAIVIQYYLKHYINYNIRDWLDIEVISKKLSKIYYKPMLSAWFKNRFSKLTIPLSILNILYQIYTNFMYVKIIKEEKSKVYLGSLIHNMTISPSLKFFPAGLLILMSLNKDGSYNSEYLYKALNILRRIYPVDKITDWEDARVAFLTTYKYYIYPTLLK